MSRKLRKKKTSSLNIGDMPTKERRKQNDGVIAEPVDRDLSGKAIIVRYKTRYASMLDRYLCLSRIDETEYRAGIRFQHAYLRAVLRIRVADIGGGGQGDPEMAALIVIKSEKLLKEAYSVLTEKQKAIVISVCGHDDFAGDSYRLETLQRGLRQLSKIWRL